MPRVAVWFAYDGSAFDSFARQPKKRTVESELLAALRKARVLKDAPSAGFGVASRTDAGVSAAQNVASFITSASVRQVVGAPRLPEGLWIVDALPVDEAFHVRRPRHRTYRYFLPDSRRRDIGRLRRAWSAFAGQHDFSAFARLEAGRVPVRRILRVGVRAGRPGPQLSVRARGFLWQQVRRMVAAAEAVAHCKAEVSDLQVALETGKAGRAFGVARPDGLLLESVDHGLAFAPRVGALGRGVAGYAVRARRAAHLAAFIGKRETDGALGR